MTEVDEYRREARFVGITSLIASVAFSAVTVSTWVLVVMLGTTSIAYLLRPYRIPRWRVVLAFTVEGVILSAAVLIMRSRGLPF